MAIEYEMSIGMLFRKMYCAGCGARLARKQIRRTYHRGEPGFRNTLSFGSIVNIRSYTKVIYVYRCPECGKEISYGDQLKVAQKQTKLGVKVLPPEDLPMTLGDV